MAVDIRATVTCDAGPLISANISDDYIQGNGLIKTRGSIEIKGMVRMFPGREISIRYTRSDGISRRIPRSLLVLSSFVDPYRKTTKIEVGCRLTYFQDLKPREKLTYFDLVKEDPRRIPPEYDPEDQIITVPIRAEDVAARCLSRIGAYIQGMDVNGIPLSNEFSVGEFDFSPGYVQVLGDLLVSECKVGYMISNKAMQIIELLGSPNLKSGRRINNENIIDVGPIGSGGIAGSRVVVNYSTLKLKTPPDEAVVCRLASASDLDKARFVAPGFSDFTTSTSTGFAAYAYKPPGSTELRTKGYNWVESAKSESTYETYFEYPDGTLRNSKLVLTRDSDYDEAEGDQRIVGTRNLLTSRTITQRTGSAAIAGGLAQQLLDAGLKFNNFDVFKKTTETFVYDKFGNETFRDAYTYGTLLFKYGTLSLPMAITNPDGTVGYVDPGQATGALERVTVSTVRNGNFTQTVTKRYGPWSETLSGQQATAEAAENFTSIQQVENYINFALGGLYLIDVTVDTSESGQKNAQEGPSKADAVNAEFAEDSGDPNNGYSTESQAGLVFGSLADLRYLDNDVEISISMPYAPDDKFVRTTVSTDPLRYCYYAFPSDAKEKASNFGRIQNRLLYANRYGMNIQTAADVMPTEPFRPMFVNANGVAALHLTNALTWTLDASGIVMSCDALYWGVGGRF
jgi:hypothetical protein